MFPSGQQDCTEMGEGGGVDGGYLGGARGCRAEKCKLCSGGAGQVYRVSIACI